VLGAWFYARTKHTGPRRTKFICVLQQKPDGPAKPLWRNRILSPENGREGRTGSPDTWGLVVFILVVSSPAANGHLFAPRPNLPSISPKPRDQNPPQSPLKPLGGPDPYPHQKLKGESRTSGLPAPNPTKISSQSPPNPPEPQYPLFKQKPLRMQLGNFRPLPLNPPPKAPQTRSSSQISSQLPYPPPSLPNPSKPSQHSSENKNV
jgi:hypothetical protein